MRVGVAVTDFTWGPPAGIGPRLGRLVTDFEHAGVHSLWVFDHFVDDRVTTPRRAPMPEAYSTLAFVAARTERIRLGTLVAAVTHRTPALLVKAVTSLDVLSGGRAYLGMGAAWNGDEHRAFGLPFPPASERLEMLEDALRIAHRMWSGDDTRFEGLHWSLERPVSLPAPLARPHPPILVGGGGERRTLSLVARYADACNLYEDLGAEGLARKLHVLKGHCERVGRPYDAIERTTYGTLTLSRDGRRGTHTPARAVDRLGRLAALGIDHSIVEPEGPWQDDQVELLAEVVAQVGPIVPAGRPADPR